MPHKDGLWIVRFLLRQKSVNGCSVLNNAVLSGVAIFIWTESAAGGANHCAPAAAVRVLGTRRLQPPIIDVTAPEAACRVSSKTGAIAIGSAPTYMSLIGISNSEVFIVDDDAAVCDALSMEFALGGYRATTFTDGAVFLAAARTRPPACVLLDVHLPGRSGLDILKELDAGNYPAPIVIMSGRGDIPTVVEAIKDGAFDFIEKRLDGEAMVACVRGTIDRWARQRQQNGNGGKALSSPFSGYDLLTPRERDVLSQITAAASNKEAAATLGISRRTVEVHRVHIMQKLGAKNTADLVRIVLSKGHGRDNRALAPDSLSWKT